MPESRAKLNRRDFLRFCLLTGAGAGLAACEGKSLPPTATTTSNAIPSVTPTAEAGSGISLPGSGGEAWTWEKTISGRLSDGSGCESILINVNGIDFEATAADQSGVTTPSAFSAAVPLAEGENRVSAVCRRTDGREERSNMNTYQQRLCYVPTAIIQISSNDGIIFLDGSASKPAGDDGPQITDHLWSVRDGNPSPLKIQDTSGNGEQELAGTVGSKSIKVIPPAADGEYYVNLTVKDQQGREDKSTIYFVVAEGQVRIPDYDRENAQWIEGAVVYGVIPRKFGAPAFKAIAGRLSDLADLGVTALWLAPINVSPRDDYGYAVKDYFDLNPTYGSKEDFQYMVQEAHQRGIRVLMDFVPNHSSIEHPYYVDCLNKGTESNYWDFYDRDENGEPTHYFNWTHLPNLNYENPEVRRWMTEAFAYWVREFDVDGFRVDAAWGVKQRRPDFWPAWRKELKRIKPDLLLLAEASARDPYYFDNGYDAAYDWTGQLGKWAWELVWSSYKHRLLAYNLDAALNNRPDGYHPDALIFRFLNNNDTGDRFITTYGEAMARVATALLLTLPGIPCIYTGDEIGAEFQPYSDPVPLHWNERYPGLREYHQTLIGLRKSIPSLHSRLWIPLDFAAIPQEVYGYIRYVGPHDHPVLVLFNFFEEDARLEFELPDEFTFMRSKGVLSDLISGEKVSVSPSGPLVVNLTGLTVKILA